MEKEIKYTIEDIDSYFLERKNENNHYWEINRGLLKLKKYLDDDFNNDLKNLFEKYDTEKNPVYLEEILKIIKEKLKWLVVKINTEEYKLRIWEVLNENGVNNKFWIFFTKLFWEKISSQMNEKEQKYVYKIFLTEFQKNNKTKIWFFWSTFEGTRREDSDIDILVENKNLKKAEKSKINSNWVEIEIFRVPKIDWDSRFNSEWIEYEEFDKIRKEIFKKD